MILIWHHIFLHGRNYFFLIKLIIKSRTIAPTRAVIKLPINPEEENPSTSKSHPPRTAPIHPTIILTSSPKPAPFIIRPASHPATAPIIKNQIKLIINFFKVNDTNITNNMESLKYVLY